MGSEGELFSKLLGPEECEDVVHALVGGDLDLDLRVRAPRLHRLVDRLVRQGVAGGRE